MYTLEKINEYLDRPREADDDYNETRALILTDLSGSLEEVQTLNDNISRLQLENESLKRNNAMLYNRVAKQLLDKPDDEEPEQEPEKTPTDIVNDNRKLYEGVW